MKALKEALFSRKNIKKYNHLYGKSIKEFIREFRADKDDYVDEDFCTILTTNNDRKDNDYSIYIFIYLSDTEDVEEFCNSILKNTKFDLDYEELHDNVNYNNGYGIIVFFDDNDDSCALYIRDDDNDLFLDYDIIKDIEEINNISGNKRYYTDICEYINKKAKEFGIC